jgi:hypothetical protein
MMVTPAKTQLDLKLSPEMSDRHRRELAAFAEYCAWRLERELTGRETWSVSVAPDSRGFGAVVTVRSRGTVLVARGVANDPILAVWEAMCRVEQPLRDLAYARSAA